VSQPESRPSDAASRGYVGPVAHEITFDAQREPMFQDDQGNGWVPLARFQELDDALREIAFRAEELANDPIMPVTSSTRIRDRALAALGLRGDEAIEVLRG
jgi:hypothetical protein